MIKMLKLLTAIILSTVLLIVLVIDIINTFFKTKKNSMGD